MPTDRDAGDLIDELHDQLREKEREIEELQAGLHDARMNGIAVGVLLSRSPGWTEQDALAAWDRACARLTRGGNTSALVSYVVQTGQLPGEGVIARA